MKKIVCIGGGGAMPSVVLPLLKNEEGIELKVISAMLDSGGSSGKLREIHGIISPGDIRRAFIELSELDEKDIFNYRFDDGHNLGNFLISSFLLKYNEKEAIEKLNNFFKTKHEVLPATFSNVHLCAELENKEKIPAAKGRW